jgi:hypothetical protein
VIDEIELLRHFRDQTPGPSGDAWDRARSAIAAAQSEPAPVVPLEHLFSGWESHKAIRGGRSRPGGTSGPGRASARRPRLIVAGALAVALAVTAVIFVGQHQSADPSGSAAASGGPAPWAMGPPIPPGVNSLSPGLGAPHTAMQLVDYTSRAAAGRPAYIPSPYDWFYERIEVSQSREGGGRSIGQEWVRADLLEDATLFTGPPSSIPAGIRWHGDVQFSPMGPGPHMIGWPSLSYSYLSSLPADPAALEDLIGANSRPWGPGGRNAAVFGAIFDLMTGSLTPVLPPRLEATLYAILAQLPGVRFEQATDLAGRKGIGFSMVEPGGNIRQEIVINPVTYGYMGMKVVAVRGYTEHGTDGNFHIAAGQVLAWMTLVKSAIVRKAGQVP